MILINDKRLNEILMENKKIIIFTKSFFDFDSHNIRIGGVETYIKDLALLCNNLKYTTIVLQYNKDAANSRQANYNGILIIERPLKSSTQKLFNEIRRQLPNAHIIIASDQFTITDHNPRTLQIQHGIAFDIPKEFISGIWKKSFFLIHFNKLLRCIKNVRRFYQVPNTVCVDYNFYNWFRTFGIISTKNFVRVIPNYASSLISQEELEVKLNRENKEMKIIFARRFVDYRGTLLFLEVTDKLLGRYNDVSITFAGDGPLKTYIESKYQKEKRVNITSFTSDKSVAVQYEYDIAVVPTIFSEGTSLSLLEAMAAGCFAIATHVGGMTNIIIDGFNGILSYPDVNSVYDSIVRAIEMKRQDFSSIIRNGYETVKKGFSIDHWKNEWTNILSEWTKDN